MNLKKIFTIVGETFAAPASGSYVVHTNHGDVVLREGGVHDGIDLSGANLAGANLPKIHLRGAKLKDANLAGAVFVDADLTGADLSGSNVSGAKFDGAILHNVKADSMRIEIPPSGVAPDFFKKG